MTQHTICNAKNILSISSLPEMSPDLYDDTAFYNDCNYCHSLHTTHNDDRTMLNEREERYSMYLDDQDSYEIDKAPLFSENESSYVTNDSRKCPRSREYRSRFTR